MILVLKVEGQREMKRRKQQAVPGSYPELDALTLDQLYAERKSLGHQMQAAGRQYQGMRIRHSYLSDRIRMLRDGETGIGISDHAVIRYMERVKGVDITAVRDEIRALAALGKVRDAPDQIVRDSDGASFVIYEGQRIATVWRDEPA